MSNTGSVASGVDAVSVAVLVNNQIIGRGIEAVLLSMPTVAAVRLCVGPVEVTALLRTGEIDFVIASEVDAEWLEPAGESLEENGPRILLLVDEAVTSDPSGYAETPVSGYLSQQDLSAKTLQDALDRCHLGDLPMPPAMARALLAHADSSPQRQRPQLRNLTNREVEALVLLARGLSNKQIARRLSISTHGAKRLVANIMLKLDSPNRTMAAVNAIRAGIVDGRLRLVIPAMMMIQR